MSRPPVIERPSRHEFCLAQVDDEGRLFLDSRKPYRYRAFSDNTSYLVREGESIFQIAGWHFRRIERGAGLWWVIADFQPIPIQDPTVRLTPGSLLILPSLRVVMTQILSETRRTESRI